MDDPLDAVDRAFDLAFCDMERTDLVPAAGDIGEVAVGGVRALSPDGLDPRGIRGEQRLGRGIGPAIDQREHRLDPLRIGQRQEHPAAFLAALENSRIGENLEVARDARLALPQDLRELANRKLHQPQERDDAQPGRVGKRLEAIGKRKFGSHEITI